MWMKRLRWGILLVAMPVLVNATGGPTTLGTDSNPNEFNMDQCTHDSTKDCIRASCMQNAPTKCAEQCKENAVNKCHSPSGQQLLLRD